MKALLVLRQKIKTVVKTILFVAVSSFLTCGILNPGDTGVVDYKKEDWEIRKQNTLLGKSMNLGNALDAPTEGFWGVVLEEKYFVHVKELGFESVRIPIRWSAHVSKTAPYTIDETFFKRVEWAIGQALRNGLRVVINIHHFEELMESPQAEKPVFLAIWKQVSERFRTFGPELYFELCNEPMKELTPALWNTYAQEALDIVRLKNPYRSVLIGPGLWNSVDGLPELVLPLDDHLILTVHYYKPDAFTHQGASWVNGSESWVGTKWRATRSDTAILLSHFDKIDTWATEKDVPIYLGEFGALDTADTLSRVLYTSYIADQAQKRGWSYAYWKYNADFGIFDDPSNTTREFLVDALLKPNETFALYYQKALLDTHTVDPGSSYFVVLDDFEDTLEYQNRLAGLYSAQKGVPWDSSFCWWSAWYNDSSAIMDNQGNRIYTYNEIDSTSKEPNFANLIGDWGKTGKGLHAKGVLKGGSYPFIGIGTTMPGFYALDWFDFSELTSVSFWAKGSGEMRLEIITDTVMNGYPADANWGNFGMEFSLTEEWKQFVIPVKDLKPKNWSQAQKDKLTWEDGMKKVCYISFSTNQTYDRVADDDTIEMYLDDIRLYGMTYETFGLKSPNQ